MSTSTIGGLAADLGSYEEMFRDSRRSNVHPTTIVSERSLSSTGVGTHFMTYTYGKGVHQYPNIPHLVPPLNIPTYIRLDPPLRTTHPAAVLSSFVASPRFCCRFDFEGRLFY